MSVQPYPAGTRVVLTYSLHVGFIGDTGTALARVIEPGHITYGAKSGKPEPTPYREQEVAWDDGSTALAPIAWLRPIQDPDAEPIETEQEVTA